MPLQEDNRAKAIRAELVDRESRSTYLADVLFEDVTKQMNGPVFQIPEVDDTFTPEDALDSDFEDQDLTVQTIAHSATDLIYDQARALAREIPTFDGLFTFGKEGQFIDLITPKVLKRIKNDRDDRDFAYLLENPAWDTAGTYHINTSLGAISRELMGELMANMKDTDGVDLSDLRMAFNPWATESIKLLPSWERSMDGRDRDSLGVKHIGDYGGVPTYESRSVPSTYTVACTGVTVSGGNAVFDVPAANRPHGLVPGLPVWSAETSGGTGWDNAAGDDIPESTPIAIGSVSASQITVPYAGSGATDASANITLTVNGCPNILIRKDMLFQATQKNRFRLRLIPYGRERFTDVLQVGQLWGRQALTGSVYVIWTPRSVATA